MRVRGGRVGEAVAVSGALQQLAHLGEHSYFNGVVVGGDLDNLKVSLSQQQLKVSGSLNKFFLGDNFQVISRSDTAQAIENLSDIFHLDMTQAEVTRIDVAGNIITKYDPAVYYYHLGAMRYAQRLQEPNGVYYQRANMKLCFYDKVKEQRSKGGHIPQLFAAANVLRYEIRYTKRLPMVFKRPAVTAALLSDEQFYIEVIQRWRQAYQDIKKVNEMEDVTEIKTVRQLYAYVLQKEVERSGGEVAFISRIDEQRLMGKITSLQAYKLRQAVASACNGGRPAMVESEAVAELSRKVAEVARYYR